MTDLDCMYEDFKTQYGRVSRSLIFTCAYMDKLIDYSTYQAAEFYFGSRWDETE